MFLLLLSDDVPPSARTFQHSHFGFFFFSFCKIALGKEIETPHLAKGQQ